MKHKDRSQSDYSRAVRKSATKALLSCALGWGGSSFAMLISGLEFVTRVSNIAVAFVLWVVLLLIPVFKHRLFEIGRFEGEILEIEYNEKTKYDTIGWKPWGPIKHISEYAIRIKKNNGRIRTITHVLDEPGHILYYEKGDRVRYRWGVTYLQILSMQNDHPTVCPFCGQDQHKNTQVCRRCGKQIIDNEYEQSEESK